MSSYEDRIRALKLYLTLGKRLTATVRQLGYPTTKSLERIKVIEAVCEHRLAMVRAAERLGLMSKHLITIRT
ncbi:hypothetical protein [Caballeronia sp. J97]|uniref:hypothetical protein n=1 Tax=Caballeronia sp. J97 TaxID=2805429 RepID=UPI002AB00B52|nr:hypothetical protein [Caballeronia sp. J97]